MTFFSFDLLRVVSSAIVKLIRFRLHRDGKERDRILTCVGAGSIPNNRGSNLERPAKAAGRASRFVAQSLRSEVSPKKCRLSCFALGGKQTALPRPNRGLREGSGEPISSEPTPSHRPWASTRARPRADLAAAKRATAVAGIGRQLEQSTLRGRLRRSPVGRYVWNTQSAP